MADNVTSDDLEKALSDLAESMGLSVKEYVEGGFLDLTTYNEAQSAVIARLDAIDVIDAEDDVETIAEKLIAINKVLSDDDGVLQNILNMINDNQSQIVTESDRAKGVEAGLRTDVDNATSKGNANESAINDIKSGISDYKTTTEDRFTAVEGRVTDDEAAIATLTADVDTEGSVAYSVEQEAIRAKSVSGKLADLSTDDKDSLVGAINEVQAETITAQAGVDGLVTRMGSAEEAINTINGDVDTDGSMAKAIKVADDAVRADIAADIESTRSGLQDGIDANTGAIAVLNGDDETEGSVAKAIKDATGGDISDLSDRMDATEAATSTNKSSIDLLNADDQTEGSVDYKIAQAAGESNEVTDALSDRITVNEGDLATLKGDAETEGSVAKQVADAKAATDAVVADNKAAIESTVSDLDDRVVANKTAAADALAAAKTELSDSIAAEVTRATDAEVALGDRVKVNEDILNDTTDEDDNLVKGIVTRTSDLESALSAQAQKQIDDLQAAIDDLKAYSDSNDLKAASMDICGVHNKFRGALGLGDKDCGGDGDGEAV